MRTKHTARDEFRRRYVDARLHQLFGYRDADPVALALFLQNCRTYDPLAARLSNFTPDARSRVTLYPLH